MSFNKVKINIAGSDYTINTTDSQERVTELANMLNEGIAEVLDQAPSASITAALVLFSLNILDKLDKTNKGSDNMRTQVKQYLEDANIAKAELERAKAELEKYKIDIQFLKSKLEKDE